MEQVAVRRSSSEMAPDEAEARRRAAGEAASSSISLPPSDAPPKMTTTASLAVGGVAADKIVPSPTQSSSWTAGRGTSPKSNPPHGEAQAMQPHSVKLDSASPMAMLDGMSRSRSVLPSSPGQRGAESGTKPSPSPSPSRAAEPRDPADPNLPPGGLVPSRETQLTTEQYPESSVRLDKGKEREVLTNGTGLPLLSRSPPPRQDTSGVQEPQAPETNGFHDEIIVVERNDEQMGDAPSTTGTADDEDVEMAGTSTDGATGTAYPRRQRRSTHQHLGEDSMEQASGSSDTRRDSAVRAHKRSSRPPAPSALKQTVLGVWAPSEVPEVQGKHVVTAYNDSKGRLRMKRKSCTLDGESLEETYPLPAGLQGVWAKFEEIIFFPHLVGLDNWMVREYVKTLNSLDEAESGSMDAKLKARNHAIEMSQTDPTYLSPNVPYGIAKGSDLLQEPRQSRASTKRKRLSEDATASDSPTPPGFATANGASPQPPASLFDGDIDLGDPLNALPGTTPTAVGIGWWLLSGATDPKWRHYVFGVLSSGKTATFRVKLSQETKDGRLVKDLYPEDNSYPVGSGGLWVSYSQVELEPHLADLSKAEVKEYCRVRQWQIDHGEAKEDQEANELKAAEAARSRVARAPPTTSRASPRVSTPVQVSANQLFVEGNAAGAELPRTNGLGSEPRQPRRLENRVDGRSGHRLSLPETSISTRASSRVLNNGAQERAQERASALAQREISRAELIQTRTERMGTTRDRAAAAAAADTASAAAQATAAAAGSLSPQLNGSPALFSQSQNIQRLNDVWAAQEAQKARNGGIEAKIYDGVKYERKATGPLIGKLVSPGQILTIDGEDYVEYRVLMKPSF